MLLLFCFRKRLRDDRRAEPRVGERVPYVIVHGSPGLALIYLVRQPFEVVCDSSLRININYYITKQVLPPLSRFLSLIGINVFTWYTDMPRLLRMTSHTLPAQETKQVSNQIKVLIYTSFTCLYTLMPGSPE